MTSIDVAQPGKISRDGTLAQAPDPQKTDPRHDHVTWLAGSGVKR